MNSLSVSTKDFMNSSLWLDLLYLNSYANNVIANVTVNGNPNRVAVNPATNLIYVTKYNPDDVVVIDGKSNIVTKTINMTSFPTSMAVNPVTNKIYVSIYLK